MASYGDNDGKAMLFLHHVTVDTPIKAEYRVKLSIDGSETRLTRNRQTSLWTPPKSLEVSDLSKVRVTLKTGHTIIGVPLGKEETVIEIGIEDVIEQFLRTMDHEVSVSGKCTFLKHPTAVTVSFRPPPTSDSVRSELQRLHEKMNEFRHVMGDSTQEHLDTVIKYGVAFSELDPRSSIAFGILSITFELLKEQKKRDQSVSDLASQLKRIFPFASKSLEEAIDDNTDLLRKTIGRLYSLAIDVAEFTYDYVKQNRFSACFFGTSRSRIHGLIERLGKSIISADDQQKIGELEGDFKAIVEDFERAVDVETLKTVRSIEETMLLSRLQPLQTGYNHDRRCMDGTRVALLDEILEWASRPIVEGTSPSQNVYWLYGIPGIGKTAMANSICFRLHKQGQLGGGFFCRRDDPKLSDPKYVLPTLVCKLAETWGGYRKVVAERLRKDPHLNQSSAGNELFLQLLSSLQNHPPHPLVLVIDGFDECGDISRRRSILTTLLDASLRVSWIRVVITSRQEEDIESTFSRPEYRNHYSSKDLTTEDNERKDINLFARSKLTSISGRDDWPGDDKLAQIVERSGGLFIYIETLWHLLQEELDKDQCLDQALSGESQDVLSGLYNLYSTTINARIGRNKEAFRSVIGVIIEAGQYQPLPDESVAQLIGVRTDVVTTLVNKLRSLLYRDTATNGGIRVRHLSIIDFLTGRNCPEEIKVDVEQVNRDMGAFCVRRMTQELRFNICCLESSFIPNRNIADLASRIKQNISIALLYSCLYWSDHLCHTPDTGDKKIYLALDKFTEDGRLLYWVEVLSLTGKIYVGESGLRRILSWIKLSQEPLFGHIHDALKFLLMFRVPIATSTPHIYVSGLAFVPTDTTICNDGAKLFQKLLKVEKGRSNRWPALPDTLRGHSREIFGVSYSPDGRYIASASRDQTIRIWDAESGVTVGEPLKGHTDSVNCIAYSPDGHHIASGSDDRTIRIWDAITGAAVGEPLEGHTNDIHRIAYSPDGRHIASVSPEKTVRIWDAKTGAAVGDPLEGHTDCIFDIAYSPDGRHIASGSSDGTIRIWDAITGAAVGVPLVGHEHAIIGIAYSPDGRHIASGSSDTTVRIWDAKTGAAVGDPLEGLTGGIFSIVYSPDGRHIASSSYGAVQIWDAKTGVAVSKLLGGRTDYPFFCIAYSPDGHRIVGCEGSRVRTWDTKTGVAIGEPLEEHIGSIYSIAYSPNGLHIASGSDDRTIRIWDAKRGAAVSRPLKGHTDSIYSIAYSPDGRHIASGSRDRTIRIWDAITGAAVSELLEGHEDSIQSIAYSPDGLHIASGSYIGTIQIWDAKTGAAVGEPLKGHTYWIHSIAYSPDGRHIASGSGDGTVRIWDVRTGAAVGEPLEGHTDSIYSIAYSPDGCHIASGSYIGTIQIWDAKTGTAVVYSPDGRHITSASEDRTIRIWDANTRVAIGEPLKGLQGYIYSVAYSPDGRHIASGSTDRTIRIWNSTTLQSDLWMNAGAVDLSLDSDGWVHHPDGGLWFWVPEDCRDGLVCPTMLTIPTNGRYRGMKIDLNEFSFGLSWTDIKKTDP
ncbi:hypothetical protein FRC16_001289 [Serendipita sp. 398]|nr:hypothetical protein FRC16_001289 [Serendipita sp. 398]